MMLRPVDLFLIYIQQTLFVFIVLFYLCWDVEITHETALTSPASIYCPGGGGP